MSKDNEQYGRPADFPHIHSIVMKMGEVTGGLMIRRSAHNRCRFIDSDAFRCTAIQAVFVGVFLAACRTSSAVITPTPLGPPPPAAAVLEGHLSPQEARELAIIRWIHEGTGIIQRFRESGALSDSVEWIVPGPPSILPFAGTWRGLDGVAEFARQLDATMRYDGVELQEYLVSANSVAAVFLGEGIARATGRPFRSEILRLYTFDLSGAKIIRVRNFYDTGAYIAAVRGGTP